MKTLITIFVVLIFCDSLLGQGREGEDRIYDLFLNGALVNPGCMGSLSQDVDARISDFLFINPDRSYFEDRNFKYIDDLLESLSEEDTLYMKNQVNDYKNFKWDQKRLPKGINVITSSQLKKLLKEGETYSLKVDIEREKHQRGEPAKDIPSPWTQIWTYSVPIFNQRGNIAIIFRGMYLSFPFSNGGAAWVYLKKDDQWELVGMDMGFVFD